MDTRNQHISVRQSIIIAILAQAKSRCAIQQHHTIQHNIHCNQAKIAFKNGFLKEKRRIAAFSG